MELREYLFRNYLTVIDFAKQINHSRTYLSLIVGGHKIPSRKLAKIIQDATKGEVTAEEILNAREDNKE